MEKMTVTSVLLSVVCILLVTVLIKLVNWVWLRPKKLERFLKQQGLSGTSYKFLFGDLKVIAAMRAEALENPMDSISHDYIPRVEPFRQRFAPTLGKDFFWFGPIPIIQISKAQLVREALTKTKEIQKFKMNPIIEKLVPGLITLEGDKWAKHRKLINPAFHVEKLKLMLPAFRDSCEEIINKWETIVAERGSGELDVYPDLMQLSSDVISRAAFGSNYEEGQKISELLKEQTDLGIQMLQSVYIPGMRFIPTPRNRRFNKLENQMRSSLHAIINKRKEETEAGEAVKADLLCILMDSNSKEIQQAGGSNKNQQVGMSLEDVIDECKLFYMAGQETTSTLIVWTMVVLSKHQVWQERAPEEILQAFGNKVPDIENLNQLKTMTMILYEVLRLYPPATQLSRWVHKDTNLGALSLPSGTMVTIFVNTIHRDKELWGDDAEEFKPDRFAEGISKETNGNNSFFPFGWGPRICIGEKFAIIEAKMAICRILQRFSFELSPSYVHAPRAMLFLQPQHGAYIILKKL